MTESDEPGLSGRSVPAKAIIEERGTLETKILRYEVFKDRVLSEGRWTLIGS